MFKENLSLMPLARCLCAPLLLAACSGGPSPTAETIDAIGGFPDKALDQSDANASVEAGDQLGRSLATGDFNGDGYPDLAAGSPYEDDGATDTGFVVIFYGGPGGAGSGGTERFTQRSVVTGTNENGDHFGWSLAAGNFNGDAFDDLAIGVPDEDTDGATDTGFVAIMLGSSRGLLPSNSEAITQNAVQFSANENGDHFGWSLAAGNFDGDAFDDLAVGVPREDLVSRENTGMVVILHGSSSGLLPANSQAFLQSDVGSESNEAGDQFGHSLAVGDFNGDTFDDLAIGAPYENIGSASDSGMVAILYGASGGLSSAGSEAITQSAVQGTGNENGDAFGWSLAVGNFDGDAFDDLAVGSPLENWGSVVDAGVVALLFGSGNGLLPSRSQLLHQGIIDRGHEPNDRFGYSLTTEDFDEDGIDDLIVGVPLENGIVTDNGAIAAFFGGASGLLPVRAEWLTQSAFGGGEESGDRFGWALAAADFNDDGRPELAVGAPFEDRGSAADAGVIRVGALEAALPELVSTQAAIVIDTNTGAVLGAKQPDERRAMASTTKIMTALLLAEALGRGDINLTDIVTIGSAPPQAGGREIGLATGDTISVEDLIHTLMLRSGNDSAAALAEHLDGTQSRFVSRMNDRATDLGLSNTSFVNPHGRDPEDTVPNLCSGNEFDKPACAHFSTARDLAHLGRFALSEPLLAQWVSTQRWSTTTWRDSRGNSKNSSYCNSNFLIRTGVSGCSSRPQRYPGAYGIKTGSTGRAGNCLVGAAATVDGDVISVVLGASEGDRYTDTTTVLDWGMAQP